MPPEATPPPTHMGREFKLTNTPQTLVGPGESHEGVTASSFSGPDEVWTILLLLVSASYRLQLSLILDLISHSSLYSFILPPDPSVHTLFHTF